MSDFGQTSGRFQTDFGHQTSDFGVWNSVSDFISMDFRLLTDSRLCFQTHILDFRLLFLDSRFVFGLRTNFGHQTSDFRFSDRLHRPTSNFGFWTLDFRLQTLDFSLQTYFGFQTLAFTVRFRTDVGLQTLDRHRTVFRLRTYFTPRT